MLDWISQFITPDTVASWVRHSLVGGGVWLADHGASASDVQTILGAAGILAGLAWSYLKHRPKA